VLQHQRADDDRNGSRQVRWTNARRTGYRLPERNEARIHRMEAEVTRVVNLKGKCADTTLSLWVSDAEEIAFNHQLLLDLGYDVEITEVEEVGE
jgi:hypothetical protein